MLHGSPPDARRRAFGIGVSTILIAAMALSGGQAATAATGGTALQLNGTSQYVRFGTATGLDAAAFTLETWFKRTGAGGRHEHRHRRHRQRHPARDQGPSPVRRIERRHELLPRHRWLERQARGRLRGRDRRDDARPEPPDQRRHHRDQQRLAPRRGDLRRDDWRLYLDGVLDGSLAVNQPPRSDSIQWAALGSALTSTGAAAGFFAGAIDEARIWNVARSAAQIVATKDVELTTATSGLLGRWSMNEGSGTSVANSAGTANVNGTLVGSPTWTTGVPDP